MAFESVSPEFALLVLESVLLVATISLLIYSIKEGKVRDRLLGELARTTKILTREDYFTAVVNSLQRSEREVFGCITGRYPQDKDREHVERIAECIRDLTSKGVKVRYLIPKLPDRLYIGYLYSRAGAEVRYSNCLLMNDNRYMVVDDELIIVGVPEAVGEKEPTRKGYSIPSRGMSRILREHFYNCWEHNIDYRTYLREVVSQTGGDPALLARELKIDEEEIRSVATSTSSA
jgi:hypothetical protein